MTLKFRTKKWISYIIIPFIWLVLETWLYIKSIWPALKEYRFQTAGSLMTLKKMYTYVYYFEENGRS